MEWLRVMKILKKHSQHKQWSARICRKQEDRYKGFHSGKRESSITNSKPVMKISLLVPLARRHRESNSAYFWYFPPPIIVIHYHLRESISPSQPCSQRQPI